jgi:hypothetical protein
MLLCLVPADAGCRKTGPAKAPGGRFDAGYVLTRSSSKLEHSFLVTNTTDRPVKILDVRKNCGCTSYALSKAYLLPNESATLHVATSLSSAYERKFVACALVTDHPRFTGWEYVCEVTSVPPIVFNPNHVNFGFLRKNADVAKAQTAAVDLFSTSPVLLDRSSFAVPGELALTLHDPPRKLRLDGALWMTRYNLEISLTGAHSRESGQNARSISVRARDGTGSSLAVMWNYAAPILATPRVIAFGKVRPGSGVAGKTILLRSRNGRKFSILSVTCAGDGAERLATQFLPGALDEHRVVINLRVPDHVGTRNFFSGRIRVLTDADAEEPVEVAWSAIVEAQNQEPPAGVQRTITRTAEGSMP